MSRKKQVRLFTVSVVVQVMALVLIATGAQFILQPVIPGMGLPWGNLLTWLLFTLFPINFLVIRRQAVIHPIPQRIYYICVYAGVVCGFLWLFISYLLSGNWAATFQDQELASTAWKYYTYLTPLLPFIGYFLMRILMMFFRKTT